MTAASIAADLRAAIRSGTYHPGDRLPSEAALMSTYGVARMTARHGLAMLKDEGLTVTRHGSGVFVRAFEPMVRDSGAHTAPDGVPAAETPGAGLTVQTMTVASDVAPDDAVRAALRLADGETVTVRERRHLRGRKPLLLATSYVPTSIAAGTPIAEEDAGIGGTHARLAEIGHAPVRFREEVVGRMPTIEEVRAMYIEPGTPVLAVTRTAFDAAGTAVEVSEITLDAGEFVVRYDFEA
ncbi:GntR family transcriptional regulator [Antribacter sp. KLBMP9083]|uniref:GntR family transcriptional regulator n=1 Tax=Antribacter soli TaxID=2910976 RepID=A0AA41QHG8_9MICO|nr:GntR family transcriptional regulator [Antribacter soli]MCF4123573.1 GntR family transcriptional regulator [Antribacter soli]